MGERRSGELVPEACSVRSLDSHSTVIISRVRAAGGSPATREARGPLLGLLARVAPIRDQVLGTRYRGSRPRDQGSRRSPLPAFLRRQRRGSWCRGASRRPGNCRPRRGACRRRTRRGWRWPRSPGTEHAEDGVEEPLRGVDGTAPRTRPSPRGEVAAQPLHASVHHDADEARSVNRISQPPSHQHPAQKGRPRGQPRGVALAGPGRAPRLAGRERRSEGAAAGSCSRPAAVRAPGSTFSSPSWRSPGGGRAA